MKIVISANGRDTNSNVNETFHRCPFFLIFDTKTNSIKILELKRPVILVKHV